MAARSTRLDLRRIESETRITRIKKFVFLALALLTVWSVVQGFCIWLGVEGLSVPVWTLVVLMRPFLYVLFWGCIASWIARGLWHLIPAGSVRDFLFKRR